ncbi:hypothetical protein LTS17_010751 [Exophiala oligosperma]
MGAINGLLETLALSVGCAQRALTVLRCALVMSSEGEYDMGSGGPLSMLRSIRHGGEEDFMDGRGRGFSDGFPDGFPDIRIEDTLDYLGLVPTT